MAHTFKNILVVRTDRIGDVVLTMPAVTLLSRQFSDARITILVSPLTRDLVSGHPDIDCVMCDDRTHQHRGVFGFFRLVSQLREKQFDVAFNFHTKRRTNLALFLARIPVRIGYRNKKFGKLLTLPVEDNRPTGAKHESEYCQDLLRSIGLETDPTIEPTIALQEEAEQWAQAHFLEWNKNYPDHVFVAVHAGSSCPTKRWPAENFCHVMRVLAGKQRIVFIMIGTDQDAPVAAEICQQLEPQVSFKNTVGMTSVGQCASLLKRCSLLISNDSGPVHVADALKTPVVSIFTRNQPGINPERWGPVSSRSRYLAPAPDNTLDFSKGEVLNTDFLYRIKPQDVLDAVDAVWQVC